MTEANGPDRTFTRTEAAAFLTDKGRPITPQRLATRATEGKGPPFEKDGRTPRYKESTLVAWLDSPEASHKGGRGKRVTPTRKPRKAQGETAIGATDLRQVLKEHVELAEAFVSGKAGAMDGYRFAQSIATLKRLAQ